MSRPGKKISTALFAGLILVGTMSPLALFSQAAPVLFAQMDQTRLPLGGRAVLTVSLQGENIDVGSGLQLPNLSPYFRLESQNGPNIRTEMSIINGRMTKQTSWQMQYALIASKAGSFTIPRLTFQSGGRIYYSNPISVEITEANAPAPSGPVTDKGFLPSDDPYLKLELDRDQYYPGQQIRAAWYLYYQEPFGHLSLGMNPPLADFNALELETASQLSPVLKNFQGQNWNVAFVRSLALFPLRAAKINIGTMELRVQRETRRRDFFGMPMVQEYSVRSEPVSVTVQPLPSGAPPGFTGAVGSFLITSRLSKTEVRSGENLNLEIEIQGDGNPDYILEPKLELPPAFEIYPPEVKLDKSVEAGELVSHKKFSYVAVPRQDGEYQIPDAQFIYFDPASKTYQVAKSAPIPVKVSPGPGITETGPGGSLPVSRTEIKTDIRFIKSAPASLPDQGPGVFGKNWFWLSHLAGILLIGAAFWYRSYQTRLESDPGFARGQKAFRQFKKQANQADRLASAEDFAGFSSELKKALLEYFGNKFNQSPWGILEEEAAEIMKKARLPDQLSREFSSLLADLGRAQYAGKAELDPNLLLRRARQWAETVEKELK